jgi:hypothetical protein
MSRIPRLTKPDDAEHAAALPPAPTGAPAAEERRADTSPSVVKRPRQNCSQLFFIYQGFNDRLMMPAMQFLKETSLLDRNLVMFRDVHKQFYLKGLSDSIGDLPSLVRWQEQCVGSLPHVRESYCLGTSMGAFASIVCGHLLKVRTVWAFGLTRLCIVPSERGLDVPLPPVPADQLSLRLRLTRVLRRLKIRKPYLHLGELLAQGNGVTEYRLFYNRQYRRDARVAQALAGCPGVKLFPLEGHDHNVVAALVRDGALPGLFPPFAPAPVDGR